MRIIDIRETAIPLKSTLANSSFDFTEMTTSVVAVITDVVRNGKPVCGFAFNSTGRYACGAQMRARFIPRILAAESDSLLDDTGDNLDPAKIFDCMMRREKAGGHSERSIAIGTIEVAMWDAVAKIADKPLHAVLAERFNGGNVSKEVFCYVGGGWYWPGQTIKDLQDEMRRHLDAGYTMLKMKVGGLPLDQDLRRLEAVLEIIGSGNIWRSMPTANSIVTKPCATPRRCRRSDCAGSRNPATRLILRYSRSWRTFMSRRSPLARTSIRRRMWKTWCVLAVSAPDGT